MSFVEINVKKSIKKILNTKKDTASYAAVPFLYVFILI